MRIRRILLCAALATTACSHEQPFETPDTGSDTPFLPGSPVQLTYNVGRDLRPYWAPDGGSFFYAWERFGDPDLDRCIAEMPGTGGRNLRNICNPNPAAIDSTDLFDVPSPSVEGRMLYIRGSSRPGSVAPDQSGIYIGPTTDPLSGSQVQSLPFAIPGLATVASVADVRWLGTNSLLLLAESVDYPRACASCKPDTVVTGLAIVKMDLVGQNQASFQTVLGTSGATSLDLAPTRDTVYFTLAGDTRVLRMALQNPQPSVVHDFGALGVPRDITVRGGQLAAVVGGRDIAGPLVSVDLATGGETPVTSSRPMWYRRPAFAPAPGSSRLVVEGYDLLITNIPGTDSTPAYSDTTVSVHPDLYLFSAP
ncbi:MAG: hypothetical protein R2910_04535 [Gemmatimonadales bacterium]